ncbi:MAG: tryptophan synthase subunit alpha [Gammaproteobacteria bacterium]|nr:tryptophan synthase subunit alpha [Gammaproteobacteria bacterium]
MSRLTGCFAQLQEQGKKAFVSFITAGDPEPSVTVPALHSLVEGGVDILELGVPFSDPEADGPSIQRSSERALQQGVTLSMVLDMVSDFRKSNEHTPIVLMGYLNSILSMGESTFFERASQCGVDGLIMVNLPPEESSGLSIHAEANEIDLIYLVAPTTPDKRIKLIVENVQGFIYYVSLKGITGASHLDTASVEEQVSVLKSHAKLPIVVGFGIKTPEQAAASASLADGIVVGSELVDTMATTQSNELIPERLQAKAQSFRDALDG